MDPEPGIARRRRLAGYAGALAGPPLLTLTLVTVAGDLSLTSDVLLFVLLTVVVSVVGGRGPGLLVATVGTALLAYFLTPPVRTLTVADPDDVVALLVFLAVAVLVSSVVDLAARRDREAAEATARGRALAQVDRTRTALLRAVSHDLRTPLSAATTSVATLRTAGLPLSETDRSELLDAASGSLERLTALVADLLDTSRLHAGVLAVTVEPVDLAEVVALALHEHGDVEAEVPADTVVLADFGFLVRVLANLVDNAVRHAGETPVVRAAVAGPDEVEVRVVDHGPGVPEAVREAAFAPFQRLGDTDNTSGVGLGLALSRGLTEAMGGTLTAAETPGGGLTMVLRLPAARPGPPDPGLRERTRP